MNYSTLVIVLGILVVEGFGLSLRSRRQVDDGINYNTDYGSEGRSYPTQFQGKDPFQLWTQMQHQKSLYPDLQLNYLPGVQAGHLIYPCNGFGQIYPNQPFNPFNRDQPYYCVLPFNPVQTFNHVQQFNPAQPINPVLPFDPVKPLVPDLSIKDGQEWNPKQNLGNQPTDSTEPCEDVTSTTNSRSSSTTTENVKNGKTSVADCLLACPETTEYDPVCGTDNITYHNLGRLECAKLCGKDVEFAVKTRCEDYNILDYLL